MARDGATDDIGVAIVHGDDAAGVGEDVEEGIDATDMVEEEEGQGDHRVAAGLELLEEAHEVVQGGLALPRGTGGEEDEAGVTGGNQPTGQFVAHIAVVADEPTLLMLVQADL